MAYSYEEILEMAIGARTDMRTFYRQEFVKYTGFCSNPDKKNVYTTEVVADYLLKHISLLGQIPKGVRKGSYKMDSHNGIPPSGDQGKLEDIFSMKQLGLALGDLGKCVDYQTPLYDGRNSSVDMLCDDDSRERLYVVEVKYGENTESLLRCVLETVTYCHILDHHKLVENFLGKEVFREVTPAVLICMGTKQEFLLNQLDNQPKLKDLMNATGVHLFLAETDEFKIRSVAQRWPFR